MNARLSGTGHGAAAWTTSFSDERSKRSRVASGRARMRWKFAGTMCVFVTRCRSTSASALLGVPPLHDHEAAAEREVHLPPERRTRVVQRADEEVDVVGAEVPPHARRGDARGVTPEVVLADRDALRPAGGARRVGHDRRPTVLGIADLAVGLAGHPVQSDQRTHRRARRRPARAPGGAPRSTTTACAPESRTIQPTSSALKCVLTGTATARSRPGAVHGLEEAGAVRQHDRDGAAARHARGVQGVGGPAGAVVELRVGEGADLGGDRRRGRDGGGRWR